MVQSIGDRIRIEQVISDVRPAEIADELPELVARGGAGARFAYEEFFYGRLRNSHTRKAYRLAVHEFLARCEKLGIELPEVTPRHVSQYLDSLDCSHSTRKQRLSALRHFFDELVLRHVVVLNPAASVRGERYPEFPNCRRKSLISNGSPPVFSTTFKIGLFFHTPFPDPGRQSQTQVVQQNC